MNTIKTLSAISAAALLLAVPALGAAYSDATNDLLPTTAGFTHLNIASFEITNDVTNISFKFILVGNPIAVNWGEYQVGIDSISSAGATNFDVSVPNGRPITMSVGGMDYYIRSWDSGAETYHWEGGSFWYGDNFTWGNNPGNLQVPVKTTNSVTLTTTLASLGLSAGDSFYFDAYTSGATPTDSAVDALANPDPTVASGDWVTPYDSGTNVYQYTVTGPALTNAFGAAYSDATNDLLSATAGFPHLDIAALDITNDATNISFNIYLAGDPIAVNWGQYNIGINSIPSAGATSGTVPPTRPITMSIGGMDYWIRSWDTGAETYHWDATGPYWALDNATWGGNPGNLQVPVKTTNSVTLTTSLASLGLSAGDSFYFDVYTSGGNDTDSAVDALANPNPTAASGDWVTAYDSGTRVFQYKVTGATPISPILSNPQFAGTTFTVNVPTQTGFNFVLEFKNSLSDASWTAVQTNAGIGGPITMTNTGVAVPSRFYRVRVQ